jgi:hypothetical protein
LLLFGIKTNKKNCLEKVPEYPLGEHQTIVVYLMMMMNNENSDNMLSDAENPRISQVSQSSPPMNNSVKANDPYASRVGPQYSGRTPDTVHPQTASNRFAVIVLGILVVIALGVAAIVLPFTLDSYCNCPSIPNISGTSVPTASPQSTPTPPTTVPPGSPTASPTPGEDLSDRFVQFVDNYARGVSGDEPFDDPNSPQYRAALFIADDVTFADSLTGVGQVGDLYALTVFYYSTKGDDWTQCSQDATDCDGESWLNPELNHCNWNWITCNDESRVIDIIFSTLLFVHLPSFPGNAATLSQCLLGSFSL